MSEHQELALDPPGLATEDDAEEGFFRRGAEQDRMAREQLRQRLRQMPRWPGLGWAIAMVAVSLLAAAILLFVLPPPR
jgi:hypothetical protein